MTAQKVRQPRPLASEPAKRAIDTPYLTAQEASVYLRYASVEAFYKAIRNAHIPVRHRGRSLLFHRDELDRWLAGESRVALLRDARRGAHSAATLPAQKLAAQAHSLAVTRGDR